MNTSTLQETNKLVTFSASVLDEVFAYDGPTKRFFERDGRRVLSMQNVAVFRSGTFRDSMGEQATYSAEDMEAFVTNFNRLRSSGTLPDVPVRKGHPQFGVSYMDGLIGYVTGLRTEERETKLSKEKFTVLFADYEVLDSSAQESIDSGLWRNRSSEIGSYRDNNDVALAPVFMGFAYVDFPAVERLNEFSRDSASGARLNFSHITEEVMADSAGKNQIVTPPAASVAPAAPAPVPAAPTSFSIGGSTTTDYAAVQQYISGLESRVAAFEAAATERAKADREAFVKKLAADGKILASSIAPTTEFAQGLTDEQFAAFEKTWDTAAAVPVLGQHGAPAAASSPAPVASPVGDSEFNRDKEIVSRLAKIGVKHDQIKAGETYARVIAKDPSFTLPRPVAVN